MFTIPTPPWTGLGKRLESATRKALHDYQMLDGVNKLAVALSGGKDSLTLLFLLKAILGRGFPDVEMVAVQVVGEFSCGASAGASYLQSVCDAMEIDLIQRESTQKLETLECYSCSRERRRLIFDAAKEAGAVTVAFGHHRDDSVETLLMNLLHKGEFVANLPKIELVDYGVTLIRPLIYLGEEEITRFAEAEGFRRITCQCPVGQRSKRRQVKEMLDELEELFPHARVNLGRAGLLYGSDKAKRSAS